LRSLERTKRTASLCNICSGNAAPASDPTSCCEEFAIMDLVVCVVRMQRFLVSGRLLGLPAVGELCNLLSCLEEILVCSRNVVARVSPSSMRV
jgi:hypothetical protein